MYNYTYLLHYDYVLTPSTHHPYTTLFRSAGIRQPGSRQQRVIRAVVVAACTVIAQAGAPARFESVHRVGVQPLLAAAVVGDLMCILAGQATAFVTVVIFRLNRQRTVLKIAGWRPFPGDVDNIQVA